MEIERLSKNLMDWPEITAFCLELRKSFLKLKYSDMDDKDLIKKIFAEIVAMKEKKWTSKRHSRIS
jgi:hypothetical protein